MGRNRILVFATLAAALLLAPQAFGQSTIFIAFNKLGDLQQAENFYNGQGTATTPNYGITFSPNFYGLVSECADGSTQGNCQPGGGGSGAYLPDPTNTSAIFIPGATGTKVTGYMNVAGGFTTGFNVFYTAAYDETVTVWSGTNGTGTALATLTLSNNDAACDNSPAYCFWTQIGVTFDGTAQSVTFTGPANGIGLTDMTIGSNITHLAVVEHGGCCFSILRRKGSATQQQQFDPVTKFDPVTRFELK